MDGLFNVPVGLASSLLHVFVVQEATRGNIEVEGAVAAEPSVDKAGVSQGIKVPSVGTYRTTR